MPDRAAYLGEPWQDWLLLVLAPVLACAIGIASAWAYALRVGHPGFHESVLFFALTGFMLSMNLFHAVQYYAVVWLAERRNLRDSLGLPSTGWALPAFLLPAMAYGALVAQPSPSKIWLIKVSVAVATLHFWYDGFVWSVRKGQTAF